MLRQTFCLSLLAGSLGITCLAADTPNPKTSFLTAEAAGKDFVVQGEYEGQIGELTIGVQVIALGNGKFDAVAYPGGLPGAGWTQEKKYNVTGERVDDAVIFEGDEGTLKIVGDTATVTTNDASGELKKVQRQSPTLGAKPPAGAIVLLDGSNADHWKDGKLTEDGLLMVGTRTKEKFGSFTLHLEFRTPFMPFARGQARGNSGLYLQDQYECQILDSFGLEGADNECGGIYQNAKPLVNMALPPLTWQTYDVEFTTAEVAEDGTITKPARTTIRHNGVVIHQNQELKPTPGGGQKDARPGAIYLQNHGDPVHFRNIWIVAKE